MNKKARKGLIMTAALALSASLAGADEMADKMAELDRLWDLDLTKQEWQAMYYKKIGHLDQGEWGEYGTQLTNQCPIMVMMSGTDPGLDCLIKYDLVEGMCSSFYGYDMEVSLGGNNDSKSILEGKRLYKDLAPWHAKDQKSTLFGVSNTYHRPLVKTLWPERYPTQEFDRVRYVMEIDKDAIAKLVKHKLFFYKGGNDGVPIKQAAIMAELMGPYYLQAYGSEGVPYYFYTTLEKLEKKPTNRKEAYVALTEYHSRKHGRKYCPLGSGLPTLNNIIATEGKGIIMRHNLEIAWLSTQVLCAMHNGLARTLGVDWTAYFATESTSKWGPGKRPVTPDTPYEGLFRFTYWHGDRPLNLIERQLYTAWLEGVDLLLISDGAYLIFKKGPDGNTFLPSDFGWKMKKLNDMAMQKNNFDRGDVYRPAALMLDRYTNWTPGSPVDAHTWDPPGPYKREIMAVEQYKKRDYMIDNFFGAIFPDYEWGGSWGTPKGDLCNAPHGDSFEVIYDSVDADVLAYYPSCFVLGEPEMTPKVKQKLKDYVNNGGDLVLNIMQVDEDLLHFAGVKADWHVNRWYKQLGELRVADASKNLLTGQTYMEDRFHYNRVKPGFRTKVLAETAGNPEVSGDLDAGWPLVTRVKRGKGHVYLVMAQYMQNSSCLNFPYGMLNVCKDLIGIVLEPHQIVQIDGPPVQYIVNKQTDGGIVVTLINNDDHDAWQGKAIVKNTAKLSRVKEWYNDTVPVIATDKNNAVIETILQPGEIRIYTFDK